MIEARARVVGIGDGYVDIETERPQACGHCAARQGCGTSLIAAWLPQRVSRMRVANPVGARLHDRVVVGMQADQVQRGALLLYLVPIAGLVAGTVVGDLTFPTLGLPAELGAFVLGLSGLFAGLIPAARHRSNGNAGKSGLTLLRVENRKPAGVGVGFPRIEPIVANDWKRNAP